MKSFSFFRVLLVVMAFITTSGCATTRVEKSFNGTWSGQITPYENPEEKFDISITFHNNRAQVYVLNENSWDEIKPGTFKVNSSISNTVISSITSGKDSDGTWVESLSYSTTLLTDDEMLVQWSRVVNNINIDPNTKDSKFSFAAKGILKRQDR